MMYALLRVALPIALAATFGLRAAHADIYTWVDSSGQLNVSNVTPPDNAKVLKVVHTDDAAAQKAQTQALADRVKQLEDQVATATSQPPAMSYGPPPPVVYAPPAAPVVQYIIQAPQPAPQYAVDQSPPDYSYSSCDPSWYGCSYGWGSGFYPSNVIVVSAPPFRPFKPGFGHGFRPHPSPHSPVQTSLIQPLAVPFIQPLVPATQTPAMHTQLSFRRG